MGRGDCVRHTQPLTHMRTVGLQGALVSALPNRRLCIFSVLTAVCGGKWFCSRFSFLFSPELEHISISTFLPIGPPSAPERDDPPVLS